VVRGERPERLTVWTVTRAEFKEVIWPKLVIPYSTWESEASLVVQVSAAEEDVRLEASTLEMAGGVKSLLTAGEDSVRTKASVDAKPGRITLI